MGRDKTVRGRHLDRSEGNETSRLERNALEALAEEGGGGKEVEIGVGK